MLIALRLKHYCLHHPVIVILAGWGAAIALAYDTYQNWLRSSTVEERAKLVRRVGELHTERREQLADITTREMGKPLREARLESARAAAIFRFFAGEAWRPRGELYERNYLASTKTNRIASYLFYSAANRARGEELLQKLLADARSRADA